MSAKSKQRIVSLLFLVAACNWSSAAQKLSSRAYLATGELYDAFDLIKQEGASNQLVDRVPAGMPERQ